MKLAWTRDERSQDATKDAPSLFTAVQEQVGLKLQPRRVNVDVLVVDRVSEALRRTDSATLLVLSAVLKPKGL